MTVTLMNVFNSNDLKVAGKTPANIVSLAFKPNKKPGIESCGLRWMMEQH